MGRRGQQQLQAHTTERRTGWRARVALCALFGVGLGAALAPQLWPDLRDFLSRHPQITQSVKPARKAAVTPTAPVRSDPALVTLGTKSSLSPVPLPYVLVGTMPGPTPHQGRAMLDVDARNAQTYVAGAVLSNGARIAEIYSDRVIVERKDLRATLYVTGYGGPREGRMQEASALLETPPATEPAKYVPPKTHAVTDLIRFVPEFENAVVTGMRVYPGSNSSLFRKWGLQSGDVIQSLGARD